MPPAQEGRSCYDPHDVGGQGHITETRAQRGPKRFSGQASFGKTLGLPAVQGPDQRQSQRIHAKGCGGPERCHDQPTDGLPDTERIRLKPMLLRLTAAGRSLRPTMSPTDACQAGLSSATPATSEET